MNQFNLGQRQIGEEKIKRFQIILLTESRRAGKESIKKLSIYLFLHKKILTDMIRKMLHTQAMRNEKKKHTEYFP